MLYDGYVFDENVANKDFNQRRRQPDQAIKFATLSSLFDISEIVKKAIEDQKISDDYRFETYGQLNERIATVKKDNNLTFDTLGQELVAQTNPYVGYLQKAPPPLLKVEPQYQFEKLNKPKKLETLFAAYNKLENTKQSVQNRQEEVNPLINFYAKVVLYQQRIIAYSVSCIIFFLIGGSLGSIIRKGGIGLPVVLAIVIFIIFHILNLSVENMAWAGKINPYMGAWLPNLILLPFGLWMTYKALTDSQLFDVEKYKALLKPLLRKFVKDKEHQRYS